MSEPTTDDAVLAAVTKMLKARSKTMGTALKRDHEEQLREQRQLDEGTLERAYWHAGYVSALRDVLRMITRGDTTWPIVMEPDQSSSS